MDSKSGATIAKSGATISKPPATKSKFSATNSKFHFSPPAWLFQGLAANLDEIWRLPFSRPAARASLPTICPC
jgi:hypothetical protein